MRAIRLIAELACRIAAVVVLFGAYMVLMPLALVFLALGVGVAQALRAAIRLARLMGMGRK